MKRSLSALIPVGNGQSTLGGRVLDLLEVLPELTDQFEIVIVDDGSTDATIEVADAWVSTYPQVKAFCHVQPQGRGEAIETGIAKSQGKTILLVDEDCQAPLHGLSCLWRHVDQYPVILGSMGRDASPSRMASWQREEGACRGGYQLIDRGVHKSLRGVLTHQSLLRQRLETTGMDWLEVPLTASGSNAAATHYQGRERQSLVEATRFGLPELSEENRMPRRPNYLGTLKQFAWGE